VDAATMAATDSVVTIAALSSCFFSSAAAETAAAHLSETVLAADVNLPKYEWLP